MRKSDRYSQRAEARLELLPDPRYGDQFADDDFEGSHPDTEVPTSASQEFYRPQRVPSPPRRSTEDFDDVPYRNPRPPLEDPDQFLRVPRRVAVRRGRLPESITGRILFGLTTLLAVLAIAALAWAIGHYLLHDDHFVLASSDAIQISGEQHISHSQLMDAFSHDVGHNVFTIPLSQRRATLESNPWVAHATVSRLLPNRLRVTIAERKPVAFTRDGNSIGLVDATGVIMNLPRANDSGSQPAAWSLPVVIGITSDLPLSTRAARMLIFNRFVADIDSAGPPLSRKLSEVDLTDPDDIKALVPEEASQGSASGASDVLVHFGSTDFLNRFQNFEQHLPEWRQLYPHLYSADMRYDRQVVLDMSPGTPVPTVSGHAAPTSAPIAPAAPVASAITTTPAQTAPATVTPAQTKVVPSKAVQSVPTQHPAQQQAVTPPTQPSAAKTTSTKPSPVVPLSATTSAPLKPASSKPSPARTTIGLPITPVQQTTAPAKTPTASTTQKMQTNPAPTKAAQNKTASKARPQSKPKTKLKPASAHKPSSKPTSKTAAKPTHAPAKKPSTKSSSTNDDAPMVLPSIHSTGKPSASHPFVPAPVSTGGLQ